MAGPFSLGARCENFPIRYWDENVPEVDMGPAEKTTAESALAGVYSGDACTACLNARAPEACCVGPLQVCWGLAGSEGCFLERAKRTARHPELLSLRSDRGCLKRLPHA